MLLVARHIGFDGRAFHHVHAEEGRQAGHAEELVGFVEREVHRVHALGFEEVRAPKKLVVTGAKNVHEAHHQFDQVEFHQKELLPFYDRHLKGMDNGFMDSAPVRLFIRGADVWREEPQWPLARAQYVRYFLRKGPSGSVTSLNDGGLSTEPPAADETPTAYAYPDWEWTSGVVANGPDGRPDPVRRVLTFTSAPLAADLEVKEPEHSQLTQLAH